MIALVITIFIVGYVAIALEHVIHVNKAAIALITGVLCWMFYMLSVPDTGQAFGQLATQTGKISEILFFLLGSMFIVELIDIHDGFSIVYKQIKAKKYATLLVIICLVTFLLSAFLNNLTTVIVIAAIINKIVPDKEKRLYFIGLVIIASNAGGAWSPIGDITTTMLWIGGRITATHILIRLLLPALASIAAPLFIITRLIKGEIEDFHSIEEEKPIDRFEKNLIFFTGLGILFCVPAFKTATGLPPFMAILLGMGLLWAITEIIHRGKGEEDKYGLSVAKALEKIDLPSILFFLGILLAVSAVQSMGLLQTLALSLDRYIHHENAVIMVIGLLSSVIDNVPLVAAVMGMYPLSAFPQDNSFWEFLAYCTGTGGSILIIGSAAGIAAMGVSEINFGWYFRKMSWLALIGFFSGAVVFILQEIILG